MSSPPMTICTPTASTVSKPPKPSLQKNAPDVTDTLGSYELPMRGISEGRHGDEIKTPYSNELSLSGSECARDQSTPPTIPPESIPSHDYTTYSKYIERPGYTLCSRIPEMFLGSRSESSFTSADSSTSEQEECFGGSKHSDWSTNNTATIEEYFTCSVGTALDPGFSAVTRYFMDRVRTAEKCVDELQLVMNILDEYVKALERLPQLHSAVTYSMDQMGFRPKARGAEGGVEWKVDGEERPGAKRKAEDELEARDGEPRKSGRFSDEALCSSRVASRALAQVVNGGLDTPRDVHEKAGWGFGGFLDGSDDGSGSPQSSVGKNVDGMSVDGNADGSRPETPHSQSRPAAEQSAKQKGKHVSIAHVEERPRAANEANLKTGESGVGVRDRWAYEAGVGHSTFSSMRRDGASE